MYGLGPKHIRGHSLLHALSEKHRMYFSHPFIHVTVMDEGERLNI